MSLSIAQQAEGVSDVVAAAKLRDKWLKQLLEDDGLSRDHSDKLAEAVDQLEDRFPEIMDLAVGEANDFARRRGAAAGGGGGDRGGARDRAQRAPAKKAGRSRGQGGSRSKPAPRRGAGSSFGRGVERRSRRAYQQTGIPQATSSATGTLLSVLGITVGLSLLFLILSNAERSAPGRSAIAQIAAGAASAVQGLILPIDPLAKFGNGQPRTTAGDGATTTVPQLRPLDPDTKIKGPPVPPRQRRRQRSDLFAVPRLGN
jgi:hypothetical protein